MTESKPLPQGPTPDRAEDAEVKTTEIPGEQLDKVSGGAVNVPAGAIPRGDLGLL